MVAFLLQAKGVVCFRQDTSSNLSPRIAIDRGELMLQMFQRNSGGTYPVISIRAIRDENNLHQDKTIILPFDYVANVTKSLVMSPQGSVRKGKTVITMTTAIEEYRGVETFILKMDVEDHTRLHELLDQARVA